MYKNSVIKSLGVLALGCALMGVSFADQRHLKLVDDSTLGLRERKATPKSWAYYIPGQKPVWHKFHAKDNQVQKNVGNWVKAYDSMNWDTVAGAHGTTVYQAATPRGASWTYTSSGSTYFANIPFIVDDMALKTGTGGKRAERFRMRWIWNSGGNTTANLGASSGDEELLILVGTANGFVADPAGPGAWSGSIMNYLYNLGGANPVLTPGVLINFGAGDGAFFADLLATDFDDPGTVANDGLSIPLPSGDNGALIMAMGYADANGDYVPFDSATSTKAAQFRYMSMCSPTDPYQPGTNATDTSKFSWEDGLVRLGTPPNDLIVGTDDFGMENLTNTADQTTPYTEYTNMDFSTAYFSAGARVANPCIGLAIDADSAYLTLNANFAGRDSSNYPGNVLYDIVGTDASGTPLTDEFGEKIFSTEFASVNSTNQKFLALNPMHTTDGSTVIDHYVVQAKPYRATRGRSTVWNATAGSSSSPITFWYGDADDDNSITVFDYGVLSDYFDKSEADTDWFTVGDNGSAPVDADFDDDGAITVFDYGILSDNFDKSGEDDLTA